MNGSKKLTRNSPIKEHEKTVSGKETVKKSFAFTDDYGKPSLEFARASYLESSHVICIYFNQVITKFLFYRYLRA